MHRAQRKTYPTDLIVSQCAILELLIPNAKPGADGLEQPTSGGSRLE